MYIALKHTHMLLATLSVSLFLLRYLWLECGSSLIEKKWVKVLPHVIDTLLLTSAAALLLYVPWHQQAWLWEKLILVICYIGCGFMVMKFAKRASTRSLFFLTASLCVLGIVQLARTKTPFLLG